MLAKTKDSSSSSLIPDNISSSQNIAMTSFDVGIHAMELYIPKKFVNQDDLEEFDGVSKGKYTIGLGQSNMSLCDDREDINSICLTAVQNLLEKYNIDPTTIGFLEVGTETIIDKSKSVKTVLMQLFSSFGNHNIEGIDCKNACYGGTNALFSAINCLESSYSGDGSQYAIVVAADIAVYNSIAARPTGGAGAVAMLLGRNAPIVFDRGLRSSFMDHAWDFYKPDLHSEYPVVDGALSNNCYIKAVDMCYQGYIKKLSQLEGIEKPDLHMGDYFLFHSPYAKLVQKSFGRLAFNDYLLNPSSKAFINIPSEFSMATCESTYGDKTVEKVFMDFTKADFAAKVAPSLLASKNCGNMYCASLYSGLASLLSEVSSETLMHKRVVLFSYGSGLSSSMFSFTVKGDTSGIQKNLNVKKRLEERLRISPAEYEIVMGLREKSHNAKSFIPESIADSKSMFAGTFYLESVDDKFRRVYRRI